MRILKKNQIFRKLFPMAALALLPALFFGCAETGNVVRVIDVADRQGGAMTDLDEANRKRLEQIRQERLRREEDADKGLQEVIQGTRNYTVEEYLRYNPIANSAGSMDFKVGGYDTIDITVYEEPDLTRQDVRVSADGYISFPFIGRLKVADMTPSEIEDMISRKLAEGQYLLDAHVSVTLKEIRSKKYIVLGSVKQPGTYPMQGRDRMLDAISRSGGIDFEQGGKQAMLVRTHNANTPRENKVVIRIDLNDLLKGGDQTSNLLMADKDVLYIPKAEHFYIIGQVQSPGSYPYMDKEITIVEAISRAGGFTPIAARNRTRIVRLEQGRETIIEVRVDAITESGRKGEDILVRPGDVIVVPESLF